MPWCSVYGCKNKCKHGCGLSFHRFPLKKPELLQLWVECVGRENWKPTKLSRVCSNHFPPDAYLTVEDCRRIGCSFNEEKRALKENAVPFKFGSRSSSSTSSCKKKQQKSVKVPVNEVKMKVEKFKRCITEKIQKNQYTKHTEEPQANADPASGVSLLNFSQEPLPKHGKSFGKRITLESREFVPLTKIKHVDDSYDDELAPITSDDDELAPITSDDDDDDDTDTPLPVTVPDNLETLQDVLKQPLSYEGTESMERHIDDLREKCFELEKVKKEKLALEQKLRTFLNSDQLDYLNGNYHKNWSEDTIKKALQIESACGYAGYQTLIEQGYPLPSYKTLFVRSSGKLNTSSDS